MTLPAILVTGGAGFVGSHTCKALARAGFRPVVYDNLSNGIADAVRWGPLEVGDLADTDRLAAIFAQYRPAAIIHFAAFIEAGVSVREPGRFYENNVTGTLSLLGAMVQAGCDRIVFSSTAAVYGDPLHIPIAEDHPLLPVNPYGRSKLMVENILADLATAHGLRAVVLRYFNASGADPEGELGENHQPETHLIPLVLQAALGQRPDIAIFGSDYDTKDGTCIRDYVHVADLADAHVLALRRLLAGGTGLTANLGTGRGFSVAEVVKAVEHVTGLPVPVRRADRRPGDPAILVADSRLARTELGWHPRFTDIADHIRHATAWVQSTTSVR